jgi:hypothetical protein
MTLNDLGPSLPGADAVVQWFGKWPTFHDGEVISLSMSRKGESVLRLYPYYPNKPATVDFIFDEIADLDLEDFSHQNVIFALHIDEVVDQTHRKAFRFTLSPCYGLAGYIDVRGARVQLVPGKSPDGHSSW